MPADVQKAPGTELVHPATGEIVALADAPAEVLAEIVQLVRDREEQIRRGKRVVAQEVHRRMDAEAKWTINADGWKITGQAPGGVDYDGEILHKALEVLVSEGEISREAADRACRPETTYKPMKSGINALVKLGGKVAETLEEIATPRDDEARRISVIPPKDWPARD
jgi:hypothetical protein